MSAVLHNKPLRASYGSLVTFYVINFNLHEYSFQEIK